MGLPSVVAAACGATVLLTDGLPAALHLACKNVTANQHLLRPRKGAVKVPPPVPLDARMQPSHAPALGMTLTTSAPVDECA